MSSSSVLPFDPRTQPIWEDKTSALQRQPAVAADRMHIQALQTRFKQSLHWRTEPRLEIFPPIGSMRDAAVLIGLQPQSDTEPFLQVVLTQRGDHLNAHPGQIAFPGGKIDATDADVAAAALREAHEEINLLPTQVQILGNLKPYETGTGFRITPVVALLQPTTPLEPNPLEVTDIFRVPLDFLMNPANHRKHFWQPGPHHRREWFSIPYVDPANGKEWFIWGVTAGILRDFYQFLSA